MSEVVEIIDPVMLDETGQRIALALEAMSSGYENNASRVHSLTETQLVSDTVFEVAGIPEFVGDISKYSSFGIQETGWYVFARIFAKEGVRVTAETTVEGTAGYIAVNGNGHVDVAVRFEVAAVAQVVVIDWGVYQDTYVFRATDLAIRNLDYLTTFYVYDAGDFATWEYGLSGDAKYESLKKYFSLVGGEYELISPTTYIVGDPIPAYFTRSESYELTEDTVFIEGKTYYTFDWDETYTEAEVVVGAEIPATYVHSKVSFAGLTKNITYKFDEIVDCPTEFILPEIDDDTHGAWYEIRMRHQGSYSTELVPPTDDIKVATEHTQMETAGFNTIDLHYSSVAGEKVWRFLNTHSSFTATTPELVSIAVRTEPQTEYTVGDALNLTGLEVIATYEDGTRKLMDDDLVVCTPASGTVLTEEDTTLTVSYTEGEVTDTVTIALTVTAGEEEP